MWNETPIQKLDGALDGNELYIKRDDLLTFSFGGNKARIALEYYADMQAKGKNCLVGYGHARSNLCRALANLAAAQGVCCHIVSPMEDGEAVQRETANSRMVKLCGAEIHTCLRSQVADTVEAVMAECERRGYRPYYINGDKYGRGNEATPVAAYDKAYSQIRQQSAQLGLEFDYVFLPCGTGMTQAGLLAGQAKCGGRECVVGISVARPAETAQAVVARYLDAYLPEAAGVEERIHIVEDYLCGGYGKDCPALRETILSVFRQYGIPMDPTYTGKAFYGMSEYLKKNGVQGKKILFLHTGGAPLFFDFLRGYRETPVIQSCTDAHRLERFLAQIEKQLPVSLSSRVDLLAYAQKVIDNGHVFVIEEAAEIVAATLFYCNDTVEKKAYWTLLGTLRQCEGKGYARLLVETMEAHCRKAGMETIHLHTEKANTPAIAFHSNRGYLIEGLEPKVHMVKRL